MWTWGWVKRTILTFWYIWLAHFSVKINSHPPPVPYQPPSINAKMLLITNSNICIQEFVHANKTIFVYTRVSFAFLGFLNSFLDKRIMDKRIKTCWFGTLIACKNVHRDIFDWWNKLSCTFYCFFSIGNHETMKTWWSMDIIVETELAYTTYM